MDLVGVIDGLEQAIEQRNDLINEFRAAAPIPPDILIQKYFGITNPQGVTDARVRTNIRAIEMQTDDCIFFSRVLADDLVEYARKLRRKHIWKLRMFLPDVSTADWSEAERTGLFPPEEQYKDWLKGFSKRATRIERLRSWTRLRSQ